MAINHISIYTHLIYAHVLWFTHSPTQSDFDFKIKKICFKKVYTKFVIFTDNRTVKSNSLNEKIKINNS